MRNFISVKPNLHMVLTIAQHACDLVPKRILKLSVYRLQIFIVKYEYLRSLRLCEDQDICGKLKRPVSKHVLAIFTTLRDQALSSSFILKMSNKEDFKDFKAVTEK